MAISNSQNIANMIEKRFNANQKRARAWVFDAFLAASVLTGPHTAKMGKKKKKKKMALQTAALLRVKGNSSALWRTFVNAPIDWLSAWLM